LLLGRDRVGICPLFYAIADGWLIWASEIKAILAAGILQRAVDVRGIDDLFSLFASGSRRTCFHGVQAICPGHYLEVRAGSVNERRYWDLAFPPAGEERQVENSELLVDELEAILQTAVSRRLIADAPRATYLSGGIDSALITAFARKSSAELLPAFTLGFDAEGEDERSRAEYTAQALGVPLTTLVPAAGELVDMLPAAVEAAESPILDMANTCLLKLSRSVAAHGAKVVLTGEGADEALGGYVWHKARRVLSMLDRAPLAVGRGLRSALAKLVTPHTRTPRLGVALAEFKPIQLEMYAPMARARSYFYSDALLEQVSEHDPLGELDVNLESMRSWHPLNQALYIDYKLMLPGHLLLGKGDRVGMRSSVENRYPFLDEAFINFAASLAPNYKLRGFSEKWLLRKLAQRVLPARIAQYPKTMFKAKSLCELGPAPRWMTQLMSSESLRATGYFAVERVRHEERLQALLPSLSPRRYVADASYSAVVTTQLWHHLYLGGGLCELPSWSPSG
jgi:asparagine synthase (glutamine-hydrolysing)